MSTPKHWLVATGFAEHLNDPKVRIIESNEDILLYDTGHIHGAVHVDWRKDLNDQTIRDYLDPQHFAQLASQIGIARNMLRHLTVAANRLENCQAD